MIRLMPALLLMVFRSVGASAQQPATNVPDLDVFMPAALQEIGAVGMSGVVVVGPRAVWSGHFGHLDLEHDRPVEAGTPFMLASASKAFTAAALLRLREDAGFGLDDDINAYLPFPVRNPAFPDRPITFRMLLNHTSGIVGRREPLQPLYGAGDAEMPLADLIRDYLSPEGRWYSDENFAPYAPGERYVYENVTYALIGYLVERISGEDFARYCQRTLFEPLGMESASWFLAGLDSTRVARHYARREDGTLRPVGHYGWPGYPDGQLRAAAGDVGRFISMLTGRGEFEGRQVLRPESIDLMFQRQHLSGLSHAFLPKVDLTLPWHLSRLDHREIQLHTGHGTGISTAVWLDTITRVGGVLLVTGPVTDRDGFIQIMRAMTLTGEARAAAESGPAG